MKKTYPACTIFACLIYCLFRAEPTEIHNQAGKITHDFTLQLKKDNSDATSLTDIKIGDTLKLQMTGTGNVDNVYDFFKMTNQ